MFKCIILCNVKNKHDCGQDGTVLSLFDLVSQLQKLSSDGWNTKQLGSWPGGRTLPTGNRGKITAGDVRSVRCLETRPGVGLPWKEVGKAWCRWSQGSDFQEDKDLELRGYHLSPETGNWTKPSPTQGLDMGHLLCPQAWNLSCHEQTSALLET